MLPARKQCAEIGLKQGKAKEPIGRSEGKEALLFNDTSTSYNGTNARTAARNA